MARSVWVQFLVCFFAISTVWNVYAQTSVPAGHAKAATEMAVGASSINNELQQQVAILKVQLEDAKRFQEQILNTVWWALGCVVSTAFLLIGFGWFTTQRNHERDRKELLQEVRQSEAKFEALFSKWQLDAEKSVQVKVRKSLESDIASALEVISRRVYAIAKKQLISERDDWVKSGIPRNALATSVQIFELTLEDGIYLDFDFVFGKIAEDIKMLEQYQSEYPGRNALDSGLLAKAVDCLEKVEERHRHTAEMLRAKLLKLSIRA